MTKSEKLLSAFAQMYFFEELVHDNLQFVDKAGYTQELADLLLNMGDTVIAIQLKERSDESKTTDPITEQKWFDNKMSTAKRQIRNTVKFIRNGSLPAFHNKIGVAIPIRPDADVIPLVVFMNESITDYPHVLEKHTEDGMTVNCMSLSDFQIMCAELISPAEMVDYLKYRCRFFEKYGPVNIVLYEASDTNMLVSRPSMHETLIHQFLVEKYDLDEPRKSTELFERFRWFVKQTAERSTMGREHEATYTILLFLTHFRRKEIHAFWERIVLAKDKARNKEYDIVGSLRLDNNYVIFFVSSPPEKALSMDFLLEIARKKCDPIRLMQVYIWWEDREHYHIDYLFLDQSENC